MGVDWAVAEQLKTLKEPYSHVWVVGGKGCPICRQLNSKHICDYKAGKTVVKLMSIKILHTDFVSAHMHSARVSNLEPLV